MTPGQLVNGTVVDHQPFGFFVDLGEEEPGVVVITMIEEIPQLLIPAFPPLGSEVEAVFLGFSGPGKQPRLSLRPTDVREARRSL